MATTGPIILIDDDLDDQELMRDVFDSIGVPNELKFFGLCEDAYHYLKTTRDKPFIIISDMNLPKMSGGDLKRIINDNTAVRRKSIPFIFLTTSSSQHAVLEAYENLAQGFFTKPSSFDDLKQMIEMILNYWKVCRHPNPELT